MVGNKSEVETSRLSGLGMTHQFRGSYSSLDNAYPIFVIVYSEWSFRIRCLVGYFWKNHHAFHDNSLTLRPNF